MRVLLLLALLCAPLLAWPIKPEVFWFTIDDAGARKGFGRGEYLAGPGGHYAFKYILVMHLQTKSGEVGTYQFDENLKPISFKEQTIYAGTSQAVTNTSEGHFDWAKGDVTYTSHEFDPDKGDYQDATTHIRAVKDAVSQFTLNIALAHTALQPGQKLDYKVFSTRSKGFVGEHFQVLKRDAGTGQFKIVQSSDDTPGEDRTFWLLPPTPKHPNGYITLCTFNSQGHEFRFQAASRAQATAGFEDEVKAMGL